VKPNRRRHLLVAGATLALLAPAVLVRPTAAEDGEPDAPPPLPAAREVMGEHFATSQACALCHSSAPRAQGMRDAKGRSVAPFDLWQATMMANAARDPLWRAVVSVEVAATPARAAEIEAKCLRCHAPLAIGERELAGGEPLRAAVLRDGSDLGQLALDGVSCTLCHQVLPENLGEERSYSGHWRIGRRKLIYGPHADPFPMPMRRHTGFTPAEGDHVLSSGLCATCHTLFTDAYDAEGAATGYRLPEQTPYLEWRNSVYRLGKRSLDEWFAEANEASTDLFVEITTDDAKREWGYRDA